MNLRPYQHDAARAIWGQLRSVMSTLFVMPTGTGKTQVFAEITRRVVESGHRVLVLAHREELLQQAADTITAVAGVTCGIVKAERSVNRANPPAVVIASVQTLSRPHRLEAFARDTFKLIVVDEAHHAPADTYQRIFSYFRGARVLGCTATADRLDGVGLSNTFGSVAYTYEIRDSIEDGWLVPIKQRRVFVDDLDLSSVRTSHGDLNAGDLERELTRDAVLHEIASPLAELAGDRPTIVFTAGVAQAHALAEVLTGYVGARGVVALDGTADSATRAQVLEDYHAGRIQYLVNCALFTEGFDSPHTSCIAVARPTKSRALYAQMIGRGGRLHPESGKTGCLVLDFVGNSGRHRLVSTLDVLDGRPIDDEVRAAAELLGEQNPDLAVHDLLDEAVQVAESARRSKLLVKARYESVPVDPFALLAADSRPGRWGGVAATRKQLAFLKKRGLEFKKGAVDRGQASALIDQIIKRCEQGRCTLKQARLLSHHGIGADLSFDEASTAIDTIAAHGWRPPASFIEQYRATEAA